MHDLVDGNDEDGPICYNVGDPKAREELFAVDALARDRWVKHFGDGVAFHHIDNDQGDAPADGQGAEKEVGPAAYLCGEETPVGGENA